MKCSRIFCSSKEIKEKLIILCKHRGFAYPSSEVYGGMSSSFDYGPLGAQMKKNIRDLWWNEFVVHRKDCVGLDSSIILHSKVWETTGHVENFVDPLIECKSCHERVRADKLVEGAGGIIQSNPLNQEAWLNEIGEFVLEQKIKCPKCSESNFAAPKQFNLLFQTQYGTNHSTYLRPETAQGIFLNFPEIARSTRKRLPFGVGQTGKSFRNEIAPGNFLFRMREFEQMELEYFCDPKDSQSHFDEWVHTCFNWLTHYGINQESLRIAPHTKSQLAHYALASTDIEFKFPFGWGELWGIANRGDYDLKKHAEASKQSFIYRDPETNAVITPHVIEPAVGLDRLMYAFLCDAYHEEQLEKESRVLLKLHPALAPFKFAILPLFKKQGLVDVANNIYDKLVRLAAVDFDSAGSIGKRYRRHDEIGTPFCITVDYQSLEDQTITIRERDSMKQIRVPISELLELAKTGFKSILSRVS